LKWVKQAGGTDWDEIVGVVTDEQGNSIIAGHFRGTIKFDNISLTSLARLDLFIAKYDAAGNVLWAKQAGGDNQTYDDRMDGIAIDAAGNVVITGSFARKANFDNITIKSLDEVDLFMAKYSSSGNVIWAKSAGGWFWDDVNGITIDSDGNCVITGYFKDTTLFDSFVLHASSLYAEIFIVKYDPSGNVLWANSAGGVGEDQANDIAVDHLNNYILAGSFQKTATFGTITVLAQHDNDNFIAKYNSSGRVVWAKRIDNSVQYLATDGSGNYIITGKTPKISKYNPSGNLIWSTQANYESNDRVRGLIADKNGNFFISGYFLGTIIFDTIKLVNNGSSDMFIAKYSPSGDVVWAKQYSGVNGAVSGGALATDPSHNVMVTGGFWDKATFDNTTLTSYGNRDVFLGKLIEVLITFKADFTATPLEGIAPLTVQFIDQSIGTITSWLWNFGDGSTSTQQNPLHVYDPREDPKYTVSLTVNGPEGSDTETKVEYITVYLPVDADFDADRTVGPASFEVKFKNLTTGNADTYEWSFGDGCYSHEFESSHLYDVPGTYNVYLKASGHGGKDCKHRVGFITVYADSGYLSLKFVKGSDAWYKEPWKNAIDGDTWGWDGTATVEGDTAYGIFEFKNQAIKKIDRFRLMSNTGVYFKNRWVKAFKVQVSTTGTQLTDFTTVLDTVKKDGEWENFKINPVDAKYMKLIIDEPASGWRQVGEFEVWEQLVLPDPTLSTIVATSPHFSTGIDPSTITLTLKDEVGAAISGKADNIRLYATGSDNNFSAVTETADPGIYTATLSTMTPGVKTLWAKVQGVDIRFADPTDNILCTVEFIEPALVLSTLKLVAHSNAYPGEDWTNAIDGDIKGWDGTVTANGWPPFAIFKFADDGIHTIQKIRMMTDTGVRFADRWVKKFHILVSTSGTNNSDFKLVLKGHQTTGDWQNHYFAMNDAKYVKLIIDEPNRPWCQLGEFEVYEMESPGPIFANKLAVKSNEGHSILAPNRFALLQNYPNPFNPETTIRYDLAEAAKVTIVVYNIRGQEVKTLLDATERAGHYTIKWDAKDNFGIQVTAGVYLYRIMAEYNDQVFSETRRMILLR
jgi:PKD repeat protein